ncbi:MAG: phosphohistidine phosphatase SixA [Planctomycetota bacterium]|jgi:phosphohistidine phosphatase
MKLYLVQHAQALLTEQDPSRPLSEAGRSETARIVRFLKPLRLTVERIWHSGKTRAAQTAEIYVRAVTAREGLAARDGLAPNDNVALLRDELAVATDDTMIVGHMPSVSKLATLLLTGYESPPIVAFVNAGIVCLGRSPDSRWQVEWVVTPQMLVE